MYVDGHFPQWDIPADQAESAFEAAFDLFVDGIVPQAHPRSGGFRVLRRRGT
jgi:hypothetical protein